MVWIDDLMAENPAYSYKEANKRPHQLFLGGDQIYADDVGRCHLHMLIDLSKRLIGTTTGTREGEVLEQLPVDNIRKKREQFPLTFDDYNDSIKRDSPGAVASEFLLPADHAWFPAGRRYLLSIVDAQMTSTDGQSHLFSFGEFAAMYLSVWSNACWTPNRDSLKPEILDLPTQQDVMERATWPDIISTYVGCPLDVQESRDEPFATDTEEIERQKKVSPFRDGGYLEYEPPEDGKFEDEDGKPCTPVEHFNIHLKNFRVALQKERIGLTSFHDGLAKVRRAMANIPTYMIFDDHDFTDDWNLNPMWYDRVYTTSLGVTSGAQCPGVVRTVPGLGQRSDQVREEGRLQASARDHCGAVPAGRARPEHRCRKRARPAIRVPRARRYRSADRQRRGAQPDHHLALLGPGLEAPSGRDRQSYATQLPLARRSARQHRRQS